ncbi:protein of unknown function [Enterobacter cancerogenus]|nr:protein of unknown function [Enterobacter cancerogenus]
MALIYLNMIDRTYGTITLTKLWT